MRWLFKEDYSSCVIWHKDGGRTHAGYQTKKSLTVLGELIVLLLIMAAAAAVFIMLVHFNWAVR